jgi:hypothetical protein
VGGHDSLLAAAGSAQHSSLIEDEALEAIILRDLGRSRTYVNGAIQRS